MGSRAQAPGKLYPRVKVREQPDPNLLQEETTDLVLRVIQTHSLESRYPSNVPASKCGDDYKSDSPLLHSGILGARLSNLSTSSICNGIEGRNKNSLDQDKKQNSRASSVPRPRAVLSSPDNDNMIGHQNRLSRERERHLKGQTFRESATGQCKPTLKNTREQSPVHLRETTKVTSNNSRPKIKPLLTHEKTPRQTPGKGKTNPVWV